MRATEKIVAILIVVLAGWFLLMTATTSFQGDSQPNRILLVELGSDAASLRTAVQTGGRDDAAGIAHNVQMVVRNTYMDFVFIVLYWTTFTGLAYLTALLGNRLLAALAVISISFAAIADLLENHAILIAMGFQDFTDAVAVDIAEYSQAKWALLFLGVVLLGTAMALNRHTSTMRRMSGGVFIASGVVGLLGIARSRVALDFTIWTINFALLLLAVALLLTLWKLYQSVKELEGHAQHHQAHASA